MSHYYVHFRAEGRALVFNYVRGAFSSNDEHVLEKGIKSIVNENIVSRNIMVSRSSLCSELFYTGFILRWLKTVLSFLNTNPLVD